MKVIELCPDKRDEEAGGIREYTESLLEDISKIDGEIFKGSSWGRESFLNSLKNSYDFLAAALDEEKGRAIGFGLLRCLDDAELMRIAVSQGERRRGAGRLLLSEMISECRRREIRNIFLEVRRSNTAALSLYREAGFSAEGVRKAYYHEPEEDAVIMRYTC